MAEFQAGEVVVPVVPDAAGFLRDLKRQVLGPAVTKLGQDIGRQIMTGVQGRITPVRIDVQADTASVRTEISQLKAELAQLARGGATVEVDADTGGATSALAGLEAVLQRLAAQTARAQVDVDTGAAQAQLAAAEAALGRVDGRTANARVDVDVAGALANIALVSAALTALPVAASVAVGLGAIGAAAGAAGIGIAGLAAIAVPSIGRITEANKAAEKAQEAAAAATGKVSTAAEDAAIAQYQQQIRTLQAAGAADQLKDAQERVKDAVAGVAAAQQRLQATVRSAAEAQAAAAQRVSRAERGVVDAQRSALRAQQDLNEARRQAARDLEDLASNVANSRLDLKDAVLDEKDAEQALARARQGGSSEEIARAEIAYERAKLRVTDLQRQVQRLGEEQLEADTKGVEGSDRVVAAKEAVEQANQRVLDQQAALSEAHAAEAKAAEDAAQRIKDARKAVQDAEKRVDDAKEGVEAAKRARKIAELQEKIRKEQEKKAAKQAASRPASPAQANADKAMNKLSPAAKNAAKEFQSFQKSYLAWQKELEPNILSPVIKGLGFLEALFKPLTPIIRGASVAVGGLFRDMTAAITGEGVKGKKTFWQTFLEEVSFAVPKAIYGLGKSFGNVITGIAGVIKAFLPFVPTIVGGVESATSSFAEWGKNLGKSEGFQKFIAFVRENAPKVWSFIRDISSAVAGLVVKLAPLGGVALSGLAGLAGVIAGMDPGTLQAIAIALGGIVLAVKTWSAAQTVLNMVLSKNPLGLIITVIGALVAAITWLWQNNETFRTVVIAAWEGISAAIQWAWENVLKPAFEWIADFWTNTLAPAATWLWQNVLKPAFEGIASAVQWAWENVIKPALAALEWFFKNVIAPVVNWLWVNIIKPVWGYIGTAIKVAWERVILPALKALWAYLTETLAPKVLWLYNNIIKPTWDKVGSVIKTVWENFIKPAFGFLYDMIFKTIPDGFKKGVGFIETAWNKVKEVAKKPVEFIVNTIWNNGILKVWNAAADLLGLDRLQPVKFAKGGIFPGYTPGRDVGLAAVSGGEAIMRPEWTKAVGEDYVNSANAAARKGGVGGVARFLGVAGDPAPFMGAFSLGGIVDSALGILKDGVKAGAEKLLNPLLAQAQSAVGNSGWGKMLLAVPRTIINGVLRLLGEKEGNGAKAVAFARQQLGKPYQWGATGPDSFDCSGLVLRALQSAGVSGVPRVTQDQIKWVKKVSTPMPGDLGFPHDGHVWMYSSPGKIIEAPYTGAHVREVAARAAQVIGRPPQWFDNGGYLMPGTSLVHNGTGRPEPVFTDQQWNQISRSTRGGDGGGDLNIDTFNSYAGTTPQQIVDALSWRSKARRGR